MPTFLLPHPLRSLRVLFFFLIDFVFSQWFFIARKILTRQHEKHNSNSICIHMRKCCKWFQVIHKLSSIELGTNLSNLPLAPSLDLNPTHLHHSFLELKIKPQTKQPSYGSGIVINDPARGRVAPQPLVRLKNAIAVPQVLEEARIELQLAIFVQCHPFGAVTVFRTKGLQLC